MTVGELIDQLGEHDDDAVVVMTVTVAGGYRQLMTVQQVDHEEDQHGHEAAVLILSSYGPDA